MSRSGLCARADRPRALGQAAQVRERFGQRDDVRVLLVEVEQVGLEHLRRPVDHALAHGATAVEAYPHVTSVDDYMGTVPLYEQAGFVRVRDANKRAIYRRER